MIFLDVESRSKAKLTSSPGQPGVGGRRYWDHPSSEVLCVVMYDDHADQWESWHPSQPWPYPRTEALCAHNAHGFDRHCLARFGVDGAWVDSSQLARKAGLRGALAAIGEKDTEGSKLTRSLSSKKWPAITDDIHARIVEYCAKDVAAVANAWPELSKWRDVDSEAEELDRIVNDRGICFDSHLAKVLLEHDERNTERVMCEVGALCGLPPDTIREIAGSPAQFVRATGAPNAQAATVEKLDHPLARARQALASIARGKLRAGLARVSDDGRLRDTLKYYGAHTGRWSGQGMQLQNLPKPAKRFGEEFDVDAFAAEVRWGKVCDAEEVELLVRATICASPGYRLVSQDYASIEARALAWAASDERALGVFRSGGDPYVTAAAAIYRVREADVTPAQRTVGKVAELACGYGGGPAAFERFATLYRVDLTGMDLRGVVTAWRELHAPVVAFWRACEAGFRKACEGKHAWAGPFEFVPGTDTDAIAVFLPSGRLIVYQQPRANGRSLSYQGERGDTHVYGGLLTENVIQAACRDLLADTMVRAEREGMRPVLSVHDEIVCESQPDALGALARIMLDSPRWASGLPISVKGWVGERYRKA